MSMRDTTWHRVGANNLADAESVFTHSLICHVQIWKINHEREEEILKKRDEIDRQPRAWTGRPSKPSSVG